MMRGSLLDKHMADFIAATWLINGLYCKVLNLVPRHQQIVTGILGDNHSKTITVLIGLSEMVMAFWILSGFKPRLNTISQIIIIAAMNTLEFFLVPDLLLWGKYNSVFAVLLIAAIYYNEFHIKKKWAAQAIR